MIELERDLEEASPRVISELVDIIFSLLFTRLSKKVRFLTSNYFDLLWYEFMLMIGYFAVFVCELCR